MNRRTFIEGTFLMPFAAIMTGGLSPSSRASSLASVSHGVAVHYVYDKRCLPQTGSTPPIPPHVETHPIEGDVTDLWLGTLEYLWKSQSILLMGVTRPAEFFVLQTLARGHGYRATQQESVGSAVWWILEPPAGRAFSVVASDIREMPMFS